VFLLFFIKGDGQPHTQHDVSELNLHSSEEEYVGSSEDDEDFIIPAKYVRITTVAEILAHRIQIPISSSSEEVKLDPRLVSEHLVSFLMNFRVLKTVILFLSHSVHGFRHGIYYPACCLIRRRKGL
jgi:hypothetical protein